MAQARPSCETENSSARSATKKKKLNIITVYKHDLNS